MATKKKQYNQTWKINVTNDDIKNGSKGSPQWCPAARAIRRTTGARIVRVVGKSYPNAIEFRGPADTHTYNIIKEFRISGKLDKFINDFDSGKKVTPFSFQLSVKK